MKIQIGKFTGEIDGAGMPDILECVTNLLVAEGWHPQTIAECMVEEIDRMTDIYNIKVNENSRD